MTQQQARQITRQILGLQREVEMLRSVLKTRGGRLTRAGDAFVKQGIANGLPQATLARMLEITPPAVAYHR